MPSPRKLPRSEYPRPQLVRDEWLCLNGRWGFQVDAGLNGEGQRWQERGRLAESIVVPFCPESRLSGLARREFMPCVWYARRFRVPPGWKGRRVLLHFGAVDYETTVWVNGRRVGVHRGGSGPFAFDITDALAGGSNLLVVRAVDDTRGGLQGCGKQSPYYDSRGCLYTRVTGIWQSVWLEPVAPTHVTGLRMVGDPVGGRIHVTATIAGGGAGLTLSVRATAGRRVVGSATAAANGLSAIAVVPLDHVRRWSPDDPFLYDLEIALLDGEDVIDRAAGYFGLRSISLSDKALLLNDEPIFLRMVLDQGFYPTGIWTAPSDAGLKRDIAGSQRLGFNGARLHQKVFEPRFLYWADRLGYLVWSEFPNWGMDRGRGESVRRMTAEWVEIVQRDFNHPSIIGWCPFNETSNWPDREMLRDVYRLAKALDPTRPVIDSSGYDHYETDLYSVHNYEQDPRKFAAAFRPLATGGEAWRNTTAVSPHAGQPYFVAEFGGAGWDAGRRKGVGSGGGERREGWGYGQAPAGRKAFLDRYRRLVTTLLRHPRMAGMCYTQLYDIEQEVNGLMTYDRKMKFDPKVIAEINQQAAAIEKGNPCAQ